MTPDGQWQDGNPYTGQKGSIAAAAWLNDVQGSQLKLLGKAGIAPILGDEDQLWQAVAAVGGGGASVETKLAAAQAAMGNLIVPAMPIAGMRSPMSWSVPGSWFAGFTNAEPLEDPKNTIEANEISTGPWPGHYWPYMAPSAQMVGNNVGGGNYPAVYKGQGRNHYRSALVLAGDTLSDRGGKWGFDLAGDYLGQEANRMIEFIAQPELDLAVGWEAAKGAGWQVGPIPAIGAAFGRWRARITVRMLSYTAGSTLLEWCFRGRFGKAGGALDLSLDETYYTSHTTIDWREPVNLALLFKTDNWGDQLGAAGAANPNRTGTQGIPGQSLVRCSRFDFGFHP